MAVPRVNLFAVPGPVIVEQLHAIAEALRRETGIVAFALQGKPVHCTLYMTKYDETRIDELRARFRALPRSRALLATARLRRTAASWLFLDLEKSAELTALARATALSLCDLREPAQAPPFWMIDEAQRAAFAQFGSPSAGAAFEPHLTLAAGVEETTLGGFVERSPLPRVEDQIAALGLAIVDEDGQIETPLDEMPW